MIAGLILAAGAGTRFGSAKQLALLDGHPLIDYALEAQLGAGPVERVAVVVGAHGEEVRAALPDDVDVVVCLGWEEGMAASVRAGVAALAEAEWVVVTLADQPGITAQIICMLLDHATPSYDAIRANYHGVPGHPVVLGPRLLARVDELHGDAGFRDLLADARIREIEVGHLGSAADIDTTEDLAAFAD